MLENWSNKLHSTCKPSRVAKKVTVLSSAKDSTLSVSLFDSEEKGSGSSRTFISTGAGTGTGTPPLGGDPVPESEPAAGYVPEIKAGQACDYKLMLF